jgi:hypothetical protein
MDVSETDIAAAKRWNDLAGGYYLWDDPLGRESAFIRLPELRVGSKQLTNSKDDAYRMLAYRLKVIRAAVADPVQ